MTHVDVADNFHDASTLRNLARSLHDGVHGAPLHIASAPATIALLGEDTDSLGGLVLLAPVHYAAAVVTSPRYDHKVKVRFVSPSSAGAGIDEITEIALADLDTAAPSATASETDAEQNESGLRRWAARVGMHLHILAARQLLPRTHQGVDVTIVSSIPPRAGLGEDAAIDVAIGLSLIAGAPDVSEAPLRVRLVEALVSAAHACQDIDCQPSRYHVSARCVGNKISIIDYADNSLTFTPTVLKKGGAHAWLVQPDPDQDLLSTRNASNPNADMEAFFAQAAGAFGVDTLRLLPDAHERVLDWLGAIHRVKGSSDAPTHEQADLWLSWWDNEIRRAQQLASRLRSQKAFEGLRLLNDSEEQLELTYGASERALVVSECLRRGAFAARQSTRGCENGAIIAYTHDGAQPPYPGASLLHAGEPAVVEYHE